MDSISAAGFSAVFFCLKIKFVSKVFGALAIKAYLCAVKTRWIDLADCNHRKKC